jgi:HD-GYP domain-containing protein (c-di-GMP phosphodiesterase class II)
MDLPTTNAPPVRSFDDLRVEVAMVPTTSEYSALVREAARAANAEFVRVDFASPADLSERVLVVDLTQVMAVGRLGNRVIAISSRLDLDCYDVITPEQVRGRLKRVVRNLVERERLRARIFQERETIQILNEIGYALSAQTSQAALLDTVLTHARRVLRADGGSLYLIADQRIRFVCSQNDTIPFQGNRMELPLDPTSLAGFVALRGAPLNIVDAYDIDPAAPYRPNLSFDQETGYRTRSMLLVPMNDREGNVLGVLALVNRKPIAGVPLASFDRVGAFSDQHAEVARSIASQAAVSIENYRLYREIRGLFEGFVEAAVTAIEARDPSTGGHSHRVAALTTALARAVDDTSDGPFASTTFIQRDLTELHYAAMLHDFGKVGVREQVLLKAEKLYPWEMNNIEMRFRLVAMQTMLENLRDIATLERAQDRLAVLKADLGFIRRVNRPSNALTESDLGELEAIAGRWLLSDTQEAVVLPHEVRRLCIPTGSLDPAERKEIESHVTHTWNFLKVIPWTRDLRRVPDLAYAHHEKLDGSGYPRGLKSDEVPLGSQLMTIADIFDALTAGDRPYKGAMSNERAVMILRSEAQSGKLNTHAVELFAARRIWEHTNQRHNPRST